MLKKTLLAIPLAALMGCWGSVDNGPGGDDPEPVPEDDPLLGAGDRDITAQWPDIDLPYSQNTKLLSYDMLKSEVMRATGHTWVLDSVDQWELNRTALGGADWVNTFEDDRTINQQKMVTIRKMALRVCEDVVDADTGGGGLPEERQLTGHPIEEGPALDANVAAMFQQFFLVAPSDSELAESKQLLFDLQATDGDDEAWRGLCAAYLSSMRFLTY